MTQHPSPARAESTTIATFFELLYPDAPEGYLVLPHPDPMRLNPQGKALLRSVWFDLSKASLAQIAQAGARLSQRHSMYFGVALQHPDTMPSAFTRGKHRTASVIPGLWFDLDLAAEHSGDCVVW
jgi:hypothetical protein